MPGIAAPVAAAQRCVKAVNDIGLGQIARLLQVAKQQVALGVNVGGDVMGDLTSGMAETDPLVVSGRARPERSVIVIELVGTPETNMMTFSRIRASRQFKGQVLLVTPKVQVAHGSIVIRTPEHRGSGNFEGTAER